MGYNKRGGGNMTIQEKVNGLLVLRNKVAEIKKLLEPIQAERDSIQADIIKHMTRQGFDSVKTESATVSKAIRKTIRIVDEDTILKHLKKNKLIDLYKMQVVKPLFKNYAESMLKDGKMIKGTEVNETEFISVRSVKKKGIKK